MKQIDKVKKIFQKSESKPVKSRELIEERGFLLINQIKELDKSLKEFEKLDFMSEAEECSKIKLAIEREKLIAQIKILGWVLDVK